MAVKLKKHIQDNLHIYLCYTFVLTIIFTFFKLTILITALTYDFFLPGYYFSDFLLAASLSILVFINRKACNITANIIILAYMFNIIYTFFFSTFMDISVFKLLDMGITIISSFDNLKILAFIILLFFIPVAGSLIKNKLLFYFKDIFREKRRKLNFLKAAAAFLILTIISHAMVNFNLFGNKINYNNFSRNPVSIFIYSIFRSDNYDESVKTLDDISKYDSGIIPDKLYFNRIENKDFNVILILMESTGLVSLSESGYDIMPNFNKLTQNGILWDNFYASVPQSIKSLFALHTGLFPYIQIESISKINPEIPVKTIAEYFKEHNYSTALLHAGFFRHSEKDKFLKNRGYDSLIDAAILPVDKTYEATPWGIDDLAMFNYAEKWIKESSKPFLLTMVPIFPHHPYNPPKHWKNRFPANNTLERFHNSVNYEDHLLGELVAFLKENDLYENTVFILLGDHGEAFGQHHGNYYHYGHIYEENINIPLLISNPLLFNSAVITDNPAVTADVLPTILELFGWEKINRLIHGKSLFNPVENRILFFSSQFGDIKYGLKDGNFKFILRPDIHTTELYNLSKDPHETNNICLDYPDRIEYYTGKVFEWRDYTMNTLNSIVSASRHDDK